MAGTISNLLWDFNCLGRRFCSIQYNVRDMESSFANALSTLGREALRIVLPSWCIVCDRELPWRARRASCCDSCWRSLPRIREARCRSCALPWSGDTSDFVCIDCQADPLPLDWNDAWGHYSGALERVLHALKFERHDFLAAPLAELLEERLRERGDLDFDLIAPVPMHHAKLRRRGYNQAALLASALSRRIGIPADAAALRKTAERETQSRLTRSARAANVRGLFTATGSVRDRAVLLVDDICTTGETLRACAGVLTRAGARRVSAITIAKASK